MDGIKLENGWKRRLNCKERNFKFGLLDCGGGGDCMYLSIAEAINNPLNLIDNHYDHLELRNITAQQINEDNFDTLLSFYKISLDNNEFIGEWDPYSINSIEDLQNEIKKIW